MFKEARKTEARETYLPTEKNNRLSLTNESSPGPSPTDVPSKVPQTLTSSDKTRDKLKSGGKSLSKKNIQRTISIAYKGRAQEMSVEPKLIDSLTRLILGD